MKIASSYIYIRNAKFHAYHGVMPQERTVGQDFLVTVRVAVDMEMAMEHDIVDVTLDYGVLYQLLKREMEVPSHLLEHVAGRIATAVFDTFPQAASMDLTITKLNPPFGGDCAGAGIELHLER